ncbi:hypothetical protein ERIC1_3c01020 [Paenibacillus larvae subsp. larvae DSM 25719]|uniref:Arsenate reductase n=1 Tax=Paenibacillus larvae subsp. larvae DSM 25430 TaxID=697284 RepID=V9WA85_9BACL|nr:hypothetical protein ERIC2_c22490 [Paenibacillus larvae subsp. larvae DSM 25430]ETK25779.1 hypothetical protein ERIC1_3c01020 [Paenibacillus larvae subsp. larvae DSM 25719]
MKEVNIDITDQTSDAIDRKLLDKADLVVTLCGHANDVCPTTPPHVKRVHWGFCQKILLGTRNSNSF